MSKKANPTVIGGFVLGAVVLLIAALAIFGSGRLFTHRARAVAFFQGNIQGLSVGSPVTARGVPVGMVTEIQLRLDPKTMRPIIPVYMEFDRSKFVMTSAVSSADVASQTPLKLAIAKGLHAKLATQSLVTGQLAVELDLDPEEPRKLVGGDPSTIEIPTSQSDIEKLRNALTELPLDKIAAASLQLLQDADGLVKSGDIQRLLSSLATAGDSFNQLLAAANTDLPTLVGEVRDTGRSSREALGSAAKAMTDLQTALTTANQLLAVDARPALRTAISALQNAQSVLANANGMIATSSPQRYDIDQALRNLSAASRSLRVFAEDLERRPNAVVMGK
ncbi:MAG TPA: MlaD family protein [Stellaceae bacterium]|nr:MlaD family protein [Stellaceae bacterium]